MPRSSHSGKRNRPNFTNASVGHVRSVGGEGRASVQDWVRCERSGVCVSAERCAGCPDCAAITYDARGEVHAVHCFPASGEPAGDGRPRRLDARIPTVGEVMTRNVLCVRPDLSLDSVMTLFAERSFRAVPVVDEDGALLGLVSQSDVLEDTVVSDAAPVSSPLSTENGMHVRHEVRAVSDVMRPLAFSVPENSSLTRAAALMAHEGVQRLAVRSADGRVVGLLSSTDVLLWLARVDGYALPPPQRAAAE